MITMQGDVWVTRARVEFSFALVFIALEGAVGGAAAVSLLNHGAVDVRCENIENIQLEALEPKNVENNKRSLQFARLQC